jgi:hypothetical protein
MRMIGRWRRTLIVAAVLEAFVSAGACGGEGDDATGDSGAGGASGSGGEETGSGGAAGEGGDPGSGGETGGAAGQGGGTGGDPGSASVSPEFEGIDIDGLPLVSTPGCEGGFDTSAKALTLTIDNSSHSLLIDASDGYFRANARVCTSSDGTPTIATTVRRLSIVGTEGDDVLIIDLLPGDFGRALLGIASAITVDLRAGTDKVAVRGTREDDHLSCGSIEGVGATLNLGSGPYAARLDNTESLLVSLGPGNDSFNGSESSKRCNLPLVIYGGGGSDVLQGGAKDDVLNGGDDSDEFDMGDAIDGADVINGGADDDLVSYGTRTRDVTIKLCVAAPVTGCAAPDCACVAENGEVGEHDVIVNVEDAIGGAGNDLIVGDDVSNTLSGKDGNDHIDGLGGADLIFGDNGDDTINGGAEDDILIGGPGVNAIDGAQGDDICFRTTNDNPLLGCETPVRGF